MGDRNNPIKFGPEWLRNLSRERSPGIANSQNSASTASTTNSGMASATSAIGASANTATPKVLLAKLRYGREEMLALYDRTSEAPQELKYIDILYQPRGKPPVALNNTFEDEMRDTIRTVPPLGGMTSGERFGIGRGLGRGLNINEVRGRGSRPPFVRQLSAGSKRPGSSTNWRTTRDDEEWRASDNIKSKSIQEKWERVWGDRPANRRTWMGGDSQSGDDNLPEWAVDGVAEACGGTFDSLGAFHGYSNDDTNLPKTQEAPYALTRSHTHGSFVHSKTTEEGSEDWWASEKANKLSPKRFDASEITFKKTNHVTPDIGYNSSNINESNKGNSLVSKGHEKLKPAATTSEPSDSSASSVDDNFKKNVRFAESKTFDSLMRTDIYLDDANDVRGNFQSVMITPNNTLRQKHQNIVQCASNNITRYRKPGLLTLLQNAQGTQHETELSKQQPALEDKTVNDLIELALEQNEQFPALPKMQQASDIIKTCTPAASGIPSCMPISVSQLTNATLQHLRISSPVHPAQELVMTARSEISSPGLQSDGLPAPRIQSNVLPGVGLSSGLQGAGLQGTAGLQAAVLQGLVLPSNGLQNCGLPSTGKQNAGLQESGSQTVGISKCTLNASLGLPLRPSSNALTQAIGIPMSGVPPPQQGIEDPGESSSGLLRGQDISGFSCSSLPAISAPNVVNSFIGQNLNSTSVQSSNQLQLNNRNQNMFKGHGIKHSGSTIYTNLMQQPQTPPSSSKGLADQWYYEDPKKIIQGPFSSKEMYSWYRAGFFSPSLMVRRACEAVMRPLGSYGPVVPFAQDHCFVQDHIISSLPLASGFESCNQGTHESALNLQQGLGLDVINLSNSSSVNNMQFGLVGILRNPPFRQQKTVESLWTQASPSLDRQWMQQAMNDSRNDSRVNNLPMFFWEQQPPTLASTLLLEEMPTKMKTEDEILAHLRAQSQSMGPQQPPFGNEQPPLQQLLPVASPAKLEHAFLASVSISSNIGDPNDNLTQGDSIKDLPFTRKPKVESIAQLESSNAKQKQAVAEVKAKQIKPIQKAARNKETNIIKSYTNKKEKEDEREESAEITKEDEINTDYKKKEGNHFSSKKKEEPLSTKGKKEDTINKKESENEKEEWVKEGYTIINTEKSTKDNKKKAEETKAGEEAELKRMGEERLFAEEKKTRQSELYKKQQELMQRKQQRQAGETQTKKAPWSGVTAQVLILNKNELTLTEIQRHEREKKLEQMKEQQHMMLHIAHQQAVALAREQEMHAGLGWAKKKSNLTSAAQNLSEIQAEARKQAQAQVVAVSHSLEEIKITTSSSINNVPWCSLRYDGGGFWDTLTPAAKSVQVEAAKTVEATRSQKKSPPTSHKEMTLATEFDTWCSTVLTSWSAKIDVPTFMSFLKDIESPYEVKDYVKCYLGDSKDSNDFARQFLDRRSKLLRVGMVTPSDDLCSPAVAINPRTVSSSDYQEVKSKSKKAKKNKMMKVDAARLLGFSVTAAEDRINVGDIDSV